MSKFKVISRDATSVRYEGAPRYSGTYLGVDYIEFQNISSPNVIDWQIGDYVDYFRTGVRYKLYTLPMPKKVARVGSYGGAIEYSNVQFFAPTKDLEIAPFRDFVFDDNKAHFSTRQDVSTVEDVRGIARRIEACLNDIFPNKWRIEVYESNDEDLNALLLEKKEFSVSQGSCIDALSQIYDTWKGVGWIHTTENGQEVITIGRANERDRENTTDIFTYGVGKGLTSIRKNAANDGEFATRLYVYGSERNLPPRYYNQFDIVNKDSADIPNLMIPISEWGLTGGIPDPSKAYLQAEDSLIEKYGLIPKTLYFNGTENAEIYPSIEGLTMSQVRQAMIELGQENQYLPEDENARINIFRTTFAEGDGSADDYKARPNIVIYINSVGFDIVEQGKKTSEGIATISIKSGKCAGRELRVKDFIGYQEGYNGITWMAYEVERVWDESTAMAYPNSIYSLDAGDEFVLLDIPLPEYYILINSKKLLEEGKKMLADYTRVSAFYEPEVNAIRMKEIGGVITPGMYMKVKDDDIIETEDHIDHVLIDSLSIDEITEIPTYKITLREEKRAARTYSVLEDMIEDAKEDANKAIKRERQHTERRFRSSEETLKMLESAFSNFSKGITPATVKTMALLIGDESLQYKFTASRGSLVDVPCPLSWSAETKQMIGVPASLIHMTLGVDGIVPSGARVASDYNSWNVVSWWNKDTYESPFLEESDKSYYVYVRASKDSADAWFFIDEESHSMIEDDYYFLVGVLNSEYDGNRDFVPLYGFTEVLPGQITTDVIRSSDGQTYFDLIDGVIAGDIRFKSKDGEKSVEEQFSVVDKNVQNLQDQIDGEVENYFYEGTPTTRNYPAVEWTSDIQKINHIGDTYTDIEEFVDSETTPDSGKSWRWCRCEDLLYGDNVVMEKRLSGTSSLAFGTIDTTKRYSFIEVYLLPNTIGASKKLIASFDYATDTDLKVDFSSTQYGNLYIDGTTGEVSMSIYNSSIINAVGDCIVEIKSDFIEATDKDGVTYKLHWHPIADTDAVKALLKVYELEKRVDDAEYLKKTFAKGETNISGGVVISQMIGVGDGGKDIEAFLNGSGEFLDNTHGKMILAGGIPEGSDDIKERSKEAKTRLYEDGYFETKDGKMELMQVNSMRSMVSQIDGLGYMLNEEPWYIKEFEGYNGKPNSPDDIIIGGISNAPHKKVIMAGFGMSWETEPDIAWGIDQIGRRRTFIHHKNSSGFEAYWCTLKTPDYDERPNDTSGLYPPYFYVDGTPRKSLKICANDCIDLYGYGYHTKEDRSAGVFMGWIVTNRTPIFGGVNRYHLSGMQEGLRPKMRTITSSETLSELDHSIMVISPTSITIRLPEDPEIGQVIECYMAYTSSAAHRVTFNGNGTGIQDPLGDNWGLVSFDVIPYGVIRFVCAYDQHGTKLWWIYRIS